MSKSKPSKKTNADDASLRRSKRTKVAPSNDEPVIETQSDSVPHLTKEQVELDARESQWWRENVDIVSDIIENIIEKWGWEKSTAKRVLTSYRQFMVVKMEENVPNKETKLYPCWSVFEMWCMHSFRHTGYIDFLKTLRENDTVIGWPRFERNSSYETDQTTRALKLRFGDRVDLELWSSTQVCFQDQLEQQRKFYAAYALQPVSTLFRHYADYQNESHSSYYFHTDYNFFIGEENIPLDDKEFIAYSLGVTTCHGRNSQPTHFIVKAVNKKTVGVTFNYSSGDEFWDVLISKTSPLLNYFDEFSSEHLKDVDQKDLVFTCNGRRLYTFDTAVTRKLKDGDTIDAWPVEKYITPGCICCQKKQNPLCP